MLLQYIKIIKELTYAYYIPKSKSPKAINVLQKVSQNKTSSNLPGAIYMTTKNGQVELQGNDFELGIRLTIDGDIKNLVL